MSIEDDAIDELGLDVYDDDVFGEWLIEKVEDGFYHPEEVEAEDSAWWAAIEGGVDWVSVAKVWPGESFAEFSDDPLG